MTSEHLLDAIGLLDDGLIREAEEYIPRKKRSRYGAWMSLAACLALVVALSYGLTHIGMGGGAPPSGAGGGAANTPASSNGVSAPGEPASGESQGGATGGDMSGGDTPGAPVGSQGDWLFAVKVDGTVYWATKEYIHLEPEEGDIRYTTSFVNGAEPEEDGQANFLPVGSAYVVLEDGTVAVLKEDTGSWQVYGSVPPWEK